MRHMPSGVTCAPQYDLLRYNAATGKFQLASTFKGGPKYGGSGPVSIAGLGTFTCPVPPLVKAQTRN